MSAKEMFERLGYNLVGNVSVSTIRYCNDCLTIDFYLGIKEVYCVDKNNEPFGLNTKELQAINKQVEELGWK